MRLPSAAKGEPHSNIGLPAAPDTPPSAGVLLSAVTKTYDKTSPPVEAIRLCDLLVPEGAFAALIGPSGCGKSTALRMIAGLERPSSGVVQTGGMSPSEAVRAHRVGVAFQDPGLLPWRSVRRNVLLALEVVGRKTEADRVDRLLEMVGLSEFCKARPAELSGGMRQRVALARTLVTNPSVLLLDEPFGALDEFTRERLNRELQGLWLALRPTTLLVTHSILEAVFLSDFVVVMSERPGRIIGSFGVPFERPRPYDIVEEPEFLHLCHEIGHCLRSSLTPAR